MVERKMQKDQPKNEAEDVTPRDVAQAEVRGIEESEEEEKE